MLTTALIFLLESALTMYTLNYLAKNTMLFAGMEIDYAAALILTLLFQNLTGVFKHQFYHWSSVKSESFLIQVMAQNPEAVKIFISALIDKVRTHQEEEASKNETDNS